MMPRAGPAMTSVVSPKWLVFCCPQVGLGRGARRKHPPKWGCDRRATKPQANLGATRRAAGLFGPGFVARSLQIHFGICSSLAPRMDRKSLAAKHQPFRRHNTRTRKEGVPSIQAGVGGGSAKAAWMDYLEANRNSS